MGGRTVSPRVFSLSHSASLPLRMTSLAQRYTPELTHTANGMSPFSEAPNILPRMRMAAKMPAHKMFAFFSRAAKVGSKLMVGLANR